MIHVADKYLMAVACDVSLQYSSISLISYYSEVTLKEYL